MLSPLQEQKGENIPWNRFGLWDDRKNIVIFQKTAEDKVESLLQVWCTGWHRLVFVFEFVYSNNYCPLIVTALGLHCVPWLSSWGKWAPAATHCVWDLSSPTRNWTCVPCIGRWVANPWITREVQITTVSLHLRPLGALWGCGWRKAGMIMDPHSAPISFSAYSLCSTHCVFFALPTLVMVVLPKVMPLISLDLA